MMMMMTMICCYCFCCCLDCARHRNIVCNVYCDRIPWLCGLRHTSVAGWLYETQVQIQLRVWMFVSCLLCVLYVATSAKSWSLVPRIPTLCVIWKPQQHGLGQISPAAPQKKKSLSQKLWLPHHVIRLLSMLSEYFMEDQKM